MMYWGKHSGTSESTLVLKGAGLLDAYEAEIRFDGCVHLRRHYGKSDVDYIHICDLEALIAGLQELKQQAESYFDGWPG